MADPSLFRPICPICPVSGFRRPGGERDRAAVRASSYRKLLSMKHLGRGVTLIVCAAAWIIAATYLWRTTVPSLDLSGFDPHRYFSAHELVFAVQQRLMAANPHNPRPLRHLGRPSGQPIFTIVRDDKKWKVLSLPPPTANGEDGEWIELVDSTVERAWDRWCYAQQQAVRAARLRMHTHIAVAVAAVAWGNYWTLVQDAERIKSRIGRGRPAAGSVAAPRP